MIRQVVITDASDLAKIHVETWRKAYKGIVPNSVLSKMSYENRLTYFNQAVNHEKNVVYETEQGILGFMTYGECRDMDLNMSYGEIWGIYVHPDFWGQSIGTSLMQWAITYFKDNKKQAVVLWVLEDNTNACMFYERLKFVKDGQKKVINLGKPLVAIRYIYTI